MASRRIKKKREKAKLQSQAASLIDKTWIMIRPDEAVALSREILKATMPELKALTEQLEYVNKAKENAFNSQISELRSYKPENFFGVKRSAEYMLGRYKRDAIMQIYKELQDKGLIEPPAELSNYHEEIDWALENFTDENMISVIERVQERQRSMEYFDFSKGVRI